VHHHAPDTRCPPAVRYDTPTEGAAALDGSQGEGEAKAGNDEK